MAELADVSPDRYAPLVAPVIERLTFAVLQHAIAHAAQLPQAVSPEALRMLGQLRTALMARPVSADGLAAVYRYRDAAEIEQDLQGLIAAGLVDRSGAGAVTATEGGRVVLGAMYDSLAAAASRLRATQAARLTRLSEMAGRVADAAVSSGGEAYATVAPPFEPPDADTALLVHTRVSVLRYHRADAHAAAWRSAGLTSATVAQLPPGSGRDAIEAGTNHGAGCALPQPHTGRAADLPGRPRGAGRLAQSAMAPGQVPERRELGGDRSASRVLTMSPCGNRMPPAASLVEHSHGIRMLATSLTLTFGPSARPGRSVLFGNIRGNDETPPAGAPAFR